MWIYLPLPYHPTSTHITLMLILQVSDTTTRHSYICTARMSGVTSPIELPVIDISNPHDPDVGKSMLDAAAKYGFLYVDSKGSDFTREDVDHAFDLVRISHIAVMDF